MPHCFDCQLRSLTAIANRIVRFVWGAMTVAWSFVWGASISSTNPAFVSGCRATRGVPYAVLLYDIADSGGLFSAYIL